jgi:lipid II isoglutaminyl synthase (glutamine-hydrolysing)
VSGPSTPLRVVVVYPDLLGTYGDGGNGRVLAKRAEWRGIAVALSEASSDAPLPEGDIYCLGGGEDDPQARAARTLEEDGGLRRAVHDGAVVLAVCAGYQILGRSFPAADGTLRTGLGLLDVRTVKGSRRAVGEVLSNPGRDPGLGGGSASLGLLTGFENHAGQTMLGPKAQPLGQLRVGVGNGDGTEGAVSGRVVGTYLHGPVLARNPGLADLLLSWALGGTAPLAPLDDRETDQLRAERLSAPTARRGWRSTLARRR